LEPWDGQAEREDVEKDDKGIQTMKNLGRNMAWLQKKLKN